MTEPMQTIQFNGPVVVSDELMLAMFNTLPPEGRAAFTQLFFARLLTGELSERTTVAFAKIMFSAKELDKKSSAKIITRVTDYCSTRCEEFVNVENMKALVEEKLRETARQFATERFADVAKAIPLEPLVDAIIPALVEVVKSIAKQFYTTTSEGRSAVTALLNEANLRERESLLVPAQLAMNEEVDALAQRRLFDKNGRAGDKE